MRMSPASRSGVAPSARGWHRACGRRWRRQPPSCRQVALDAPSADGARLVLELSARRRPKRCSRSSNPDRLVIDLPAHPPGQPALRHARTQQGPVQSLRSGMQPKADPATGDAS